MSTVDPGWSTNGPQAGGSSNTRNETALTWTERHLNIGDAPEVVPAPIRALYEDPSPFIVVMKGAQMTLSEWVLNLCLYTADVGRAGRGNALYVQPGGENVGDFVSSRVNPIIENSPYLQTRIPQPGQKQPNRIGLTKVGLGFTFWRTAYVAGRGQRNRSGLKSVPADTVILDEFDEMPEGTLDLVSHRLDSSRDPWTRVISTPTYPDTGIDKLYKLGTRLRYWLTCANCETEQHLTWERNVVLIEDPDAPNDQRRVRVCSNAECGASLERVIDRAWYDPSAGHWAPEEGWTGGEYPSYHISQLYRPGIDLDAINDALHSTDLEKMQEAYNQHLGLAFVPPGGRFPFVREYFAENRYDPSDPRLRNMVGARWISWDTAMKDKSTNDYSSAAVLELQPDYRLLVREVYRARLLFPDLPAAIQELAQRYNRDGKLRGVIIEDKGSGTSAYQTLMANAPDWLRPMLIPFTPEGSKEYRASQAAVWAKEGCILLPRPGPEVAWLPDFELELFAFSSKNTSSQRQTAPHDDQVDCLSQGILFLEHLLEEGLRARRAYNRAQAEDGAVDMEGIRV